MRIILTVFLIISAIYIFPQKMKEPSQDLKNNSEVMKKDSSDLETEAAKKSQKEKRVFRNSEIELIENEAILLWTINDETGIVNYLIEKINSDEQEIIGVIKSRGNTTIASEYNFADIINEEDMKEEILIYRVSAADTSGNKIIWKEFKLYPAKLVDGYDLLQNYPNPFNPFTKIKYSIPYQQHVIIKVFNILGNEVATLVDEVKPGGTYEVEFNASRLTSGVYLYTLQAGEISETKRMILMK
jgi:hypothetical protein